MSVTYSSERLLHAQSQQSRSDLFPSTKMPKPSRSTHVVIRQLPTILICFILAGCPARKPVTSTAPSFRLASVNGKSLLLSPAIPAQRPLGLSISLTLSANKELSAIPSACSIARGLFSVEQDPSDSNFHVSLAPPNKWLGPNILISDEIDVFEQLYDFLADVDAAERAGCFAAAESPVRDYILLSVPTPPADSLFNAYGYRIERSGVNLKPDLRLKVERAYFSSAEKSDKNYLGISSVFFGVTKDSEGWVRFQQSQALQYSPESLSQSDHEGSRDLAILDLKPQTHYRVLFYTHQVPTDQSFSAALIGANDSVRLDQFERSMRADAGASCSSSPHEDIQCLEFRGFVTVSVQIAIELNGQPKFVDWGTRVKDLVPPKSRKSLKIQRRFANSYFPITFARSDSAILDLTLVGADSLTW
jgi:hypothetical protein